MLCKTSSISLSILLAAGIAIATAAAAIAADSPAELKATLYVAPGGNDAWSGKLAAANAEKTDGPFATLEKARDALRAIDRKGQKTPLVVMLRGGKYFRRGPFVLDAQDGGTADAPVIYTAYPGEQPVLSGGRTVAGWRPYQGKIVQAAIPEGAGGKWKFRQLFYHGQREVRARTFNFDPRKPFAAGWNRMEGPAEPKSEIAFKFNPADFPRRWAKPTEAEVNLFFGADWGNNIIPIRSFEAEKRVIRLAHGMTCNSKPLAILPYTSNPAWLVDQQDDLLAFHRGQRYFVENVLEELDQPGEWCWDSQEGKLYFWPPDGVSAPAEVVIPALDTLISLRRSSYVVVAGLGFTETDGGDNIFRDGADGIGAQFPTPGWKYCGEAVHLQGAAGCRIERNHFFNLGGNGVYLEGACIRNTVGGNEIAEVGACGVALAGAGADYPLFNEITGNHISRPGVINFYSAGVFLGLSEGTVIGHNRIEHVPQHAINLGNEGRSRNIVEYNALCDTCLVCSDTGALNCWMEPEPRHGVRQGHIIRYNLIAGSRERGIYLDNYTSNCHVYGNIVVGAASDGIYIHGGRNNLIENNIIADCHRALMAANYIDRWMPAMAGFLSGNRFAHNIVYGGYEALAVHGVPAARAFSQADENVFYKVLGAEPYLARQRSIGLERHSQIVDPKFLDPAAWDFRLRPDSPALKMGFQPIEDSQIGVPRR